MNTNLNVDRGPSTVILLYATSRAAAHACMHAAIRRVHNQRDEQSEVEMSTSRAAAHACMHAAIRRVHNQRDEQSEVEMKSGGKSSR